MPPAPEVTVPEDPGAGTAVTLPPEEIEYGIYEHEITVGGRTHRGSVEFTNFLASCYAEYGLAVEVVGPGELLVHSGGQADAHNRATLECDERAVESGLVGLGMSDLPPPEVLEVWYRAYTEVAYECLVENGHVPEDPPSLETWVQDPSTWLPHDRVPPNSELFETCTEDIVMLLIELGKRDEATGVTAP